MTLLPLSGRLQSLVRDAPPGAREAIKRDVELLINAGVRTDADLLKLIAPTVPAETAATACWAAERLQLSNAVDAIVELVMVTEDQSALTQAGKALEGLATPEAVEKVIAILKKANSARGRATAAWVLGSLDDKRAEGALIEVLRNTKEATDVRVEAAEALGSVGTPASIPALIEGLRDDQVEVRFWSAFALGKVGDETVIPFLQNIAEDSAIVPNWGDVGSEARKAIEWIQMTEGK